MRQYLLSVILLTAAIITIYLERGFDVAALWGASAILFGSSVSLAGKVGLLMKISAAVLVTLSAGYLFYQTAYAALGLMLFSALIVVCFSRAP